MWQRYLLIAAGVTAVATGSAASADIVWPEGSESILDFAFNTLDGDFDAASGVFSAVASDSGDLVSSGNVRRLVPDTGTADFGPGFASGATLADFNLTLNVFNIDNVNGMADATGAFTITDADGDTLSGLVNGVWIQNGGAMFFNGSLSDVVLTDNFAQDGRFDGPDGGSFDLAFDDFVSPFEGALVLLQLEASPGFFGSDFFNRATDAAGQIVPAPAALSMLGLGLFGLGARRRRR